MSALQQEGFLRQSDSSPTLESVCISEASTPKVLEHRLSRQCVSVCADEKHGRQKLLLPRVPPQDNNWGRAGMSMCARMCACVCVAVVSAGAAFGPVAAAPDVIRLSRSLAAEDGSACPEEEDEEGSRMRRERCRETET